MKLSASRAIVLAIVAAHFPATAFCASAQSSPQADSSANGGVRQRLVRLTTPEASPDAKNAAKALAEKFSGGALQSETAAAPAPEPAAAPMMAALSESARAIGDHAANNATFSKQAEAAAERRQARALQKKKIAKQTLAGRQGDAAAVAPSRQAQPRGAAPKDDEKQADEPTLLQKIFSPTLWSLPGKETPGSDTPLPDGDLRSALQDGP